MAQLLSLPEELLQHICVQLRPPSGLEVSREAEEAKRTHMRNLHSMALCSRACHRVARREIYRKLDFTTGRELRDLRPLLRILLFKSGRAELVKEIRVPHFDSQATIASWRNTSEGRHTTEPRTTEQDPSLIDASLAIAGFSLQIALRQQLQFGLDAHLLDAELALLLLLCRNVNILHLTIQHGFKKSLIAAIMHHCHIEITSTVRPDRSLRSLREVVIENRRHPKWREHDFTQFSMLLDLPSLTLMRFRRLHILHVKPPSRSVGSASVLRHLYLQDAQVDASALDWIFAQFPHLEIFSLQRDTDFAMETGLHCGTESAAINRAGRTLKHLAFDKWTHYPSTTWDFCPPISSLQALTSLQSLRIMADAIFGWPARATDELPAQLTHVIPYSLRSLSITWMRDGDAETQDELLWQLMKDQRFVSLIYVGLSRSKPFSKNLRGSPWTETTQDDSLSAKESSDDLNTSVEGCVSDLDNGWKILKRK